MNNRFHEKREIENLIKEQKEIYDNLMIKIMKLYKDSDYFVFHYIINFCKKIKFFKI